MKRILALCLAIGLLFGASGISYASGTSQFNKASEVYGTWYSMDLKDIVEVSSTKIVLYRRSEALKTFTKLVEIKKPLTLSKDKTKLSLSFTHPKQAEPVLIQFIRSGGTFSISNNYESMGYFYDIKRARNLNEAMQKILNDKSLTQKINREKDKLRHTISEYEGNIFSIEETIAYYEDYIIGHNKDIDALNKSELLMGRLPQSFASGAVATSAGWNSNGALSVDLPRSSYEKIHFFKGENQLYFFNTVYKSFDQKETLKNEDGTVTLVWQCYEKEPSKPFDIKNHF